MYLHSDVYKFLSLLACFSPKFCVMFCGNLKIVNVNDGYLVFNHFGFFSEKPKKVAVVLKEVGDGV